VEVLASVRGRLLNATPVVNLVIMLDLGEKKSKAD